ncbi:MAG: hypothetical protein AB7G80_06605 [Dongiaceae bacterium]
MKDSIYMTPEERAVVVTKANNFSTFVVTSRLRDIAAPFMPFTGWGTILGSCFLAVVALNAVTLMALATWMVAAAVTMGLGILQCYLGRDWRATKEVRADILILAGRHLHPRNQARPVNVVACNSASSQSPPRGPVRER